MTTYYVSSEIGSNNNAGTSESAPLASLQAAANLVQPGDTVEVMNGTYTGNAPGGGDVVDITTSGTASAPITFEAAPGQTPVINSSGGWNAINIEASYIVVSGFTVVGDAANYTSAQALAGYSTGNPSLDGNGIVVPSPGNGVVPNHITIENNTVYDEPGGGISTGGADYLQILNNVVYDNAHWSAFGTSGISVGASANSDTNPGVHDVISGNIVFGNAQEVPTTGGNTITDGEGIILDTNTGSGAADPGYVGEFLVENNTVYNNGSSGIESFLTNDAVITGNTVYGNDTENVQPASDAEILINQSNNNTVTNNTTTAPDLTAPAAPVISGDTANYGNTVTLNGTGETGTTITVFDNSTQLGTTVTNSSGMWTFTTGALANGSQSFTATQTDSAGGVSPVSSALDMTVNAPVNLVASGNFATGDFTDWTLGGDYTNGQIFIDTNGEGGSTYAAGLGSEGADGTLSQTIATTPGQTYTLSFWLQNEASEGNDFNATWNGQTLLSLTNASAFGYTEYSYTVTATSSTTTLEFSAANSPSQWDLDNISLTPNGTSTTPPPAAPVISSDTVSSSDAVTLKGTAPDGATVTVLDGGTALGTTTASSTGSWSFTTTDLQAGSYTFAATDTTSAGTSAASSPFPVTVTSASSPPAAPVIGSDTVSSSDAVTLKGTAPDGATVTVSDGTSLGTTTASSTGSWSFTTTALQAGSYTFTATDTTSAGTSAASSPFGVTVAPSDPPPPASGANLVANGNFATGDFTDWTLGGNAIWQNSLPEIFIDTSAEGSSTYAAGMGSMGPSSSSDGTLSQTIATTPGQTYTLSFWLQNEGSTGGNDFQAIWNGQTLLSLSNAPQSGYTEYTYTVTATGSASTLEFSALNNPSQWDLDNVSLTATGSTAAPAVQSGAVNIVGTDPTVTLTGTAPDGATVTVSDGGSTPLGSTTASSSGAWSFTTPDLPAGNYAFTVTDTTPTGTTTTSKPFDVTVPTPSAGGGASGLPRIAFDPPSTLGSWSNSNQTGSTSSFADIALLGSHIASSFALPSGSYGGTMVNPEFTAFGTQPLVANPHHA